MNFYGDYHTHTTFSHGKGSVLDNALSAKEKGLIQLGISDHGFSHPAFGLKKNRLAELKRECVEAEDRTGVRVLMGVESNIISSSGECDLNDSLYEKFDIFLAGAHVFVRYRDFPLAFNFGAKCPIMNSFNLKPSQKLKNYITKVYINAVSTQPIDVLTHLDFRVFANVKEVADCCRQYGTYVEINTKKTHMTDEQWIDVSNTGVNFVIGSDAHSPDRIADFEKGIALAKRVGISEDRIHNLARTPDFRFAKYKGVKL